ncbi:MAG TPA: M3 family oligoendopeptidase [Candidatus Dormibacteraeota bacterium]
MAAQGTQVTGAEEIRWDLTELFASPHDPAIDAVLKEALEFAQEFEERYKGRIAQLGPPDFAVLMDALAEHYDAVSKPSLYANLMHSRDTQDTDAGRLVARVREAGAERGKHLVFFNLELAALSDERARELYEHEASSRYRHTIEEARRYRPHQLTEVEERLLTETSPVGTSAWTRLFGELCAGIRVDLDGSEMPLALALARLRVTDRATREAASHAITAALRRDLRTRSYVLNVVAQDHAIEDRLRSYPTWISSRNLSNETSDEAVQALVEAVTSRYGAVERYYRVKGRLLGLERLHEWDRYAPLEGTERVISWDAAKELVLGSYHRLSPRAGRLVEEFFAHPWIDAPVTAGKSGGAFCAGATPSFHPYVLMNFTGKLGDALTLAHELGHGLHDRLAAKQHIFDYHPPLTLAETASVFGEAMTFDRILAEESDPKIRLALLCYQVEQAFATIYRQVAMNRFEDAVHNTRRSEGELSPDQLSEIWQDQSRRMFGDSVELTEEHGAWWSYVEHFVQAPGYVYAYAFGNLLALSIYRRYRQLGGDFVDSYLDFLAAGGSRPPDELVATLGMDIRDAGFWSAGLDILDEMIDQVETLAGGVVGTAG